MGDRTSIEWTRGDDGTPGATWNPIRGCTKVSPGCDNCYAETLVNGRLKHQHPGGFEQVMLLPDRLDQPLRWRRPRRIFVNSLSDLFHESVPDIYLSQVFDVMERASHHTFQVLTKRHGRMRSYVTARMARKREYADKFADCPTEEMRNSPAAKDARERADRPPSNIWLGVSVEDQKWADIRIPALLETPASVRFISAEPLLGPIDLRGHLNGHCAEHDFPGGFCIQRHHPGVEHLHWVIAGGESGPGARPMHPDWARQLRDHCQAAGVPYLFKQWGTWAPNGHWGWGNGGPNTIYLKPYLPRPDRMHEAEGYSLSRVGKKAAGRVLDGRTWDEMPAASQ